MYLKKTKERQASWCGDAWVIEDVTLYQWFETDKDVIISPVFRDFREVINFAIERDNHV